MKTPREQTLAERPHRLPVGLKLGFGIADLGGNLFFTMMGFYLLAFLTDTFGIAAGAAGTILT